jgi:hypothetical protein
MSLAKGPETARVRTGRLEFRTLRRQVNGNGGPTLEVHAEWATGRWRQVIRFD